MYRLILVLFLLAVPALAGASAATAEEWPELVPESVTLGDYQDTIECGADLRPVVRPDTCLTTVRCKTQKFSAQWTQANLYTVLRYEGSFKVCYRLNDGIVSVKYRFGDATFVRGPWEWRGNDSGYPNHIRNAHNVVFNFRGSTAFCVTHIGCGPERHPWVRITFYDSNTLDKDVGVV